MSRDVGTKGPAECRDAVNQSFVDGKFCFKKACLFSLTLGMAPCEFEFV